jgi:hypothetical protein
MGAIAVLVEEGRNVGIGVTLVTQRSARLNKDVAELADCMIAFRIVGPNSMRAVLDWLGEHVDKARLKDIGEKVAQPAARIGARRVAGLARVRGHRRDAQAPTFDSSRRRSREGAAARRARREADLEKYRARMAEIIERARRTIRRRSARASPSSRSSSRRSRRSRPVRRPRSYRPRALCRRPRSLPRRLSRRATGSEHRR